ncbi:MAG: S1 family peptidase [Akkermansiaceae bacterium]|jgi:V8-like Glu-specific endopeptidase|nr:S1 family peptidase [Akkermansiaceae bacterium]
MKPTIKLAILAGLSLASVLPAGAITWRSQYYNLTSARDFGRDHGSFAGTGHNWSCTGNLILQKNRILTAAHCPQGSSWTVRTHAATGVSSSVAKSDQDVRLVKLNANNGGTPVQLWDNGSEPGKTFHKAGYGRYGAIDAVSSGTWMGAGEPLAGHNTYTVNSGNTVRFVLKTNAYSVGTAPGDSGGPGLMKLANGQWSVSSTTMGPGSGYYNESRVWHARNWILQNL